MLVIYNAIIHEEVLLQGVSVTCMLEVTASSLMSSCSQICWEVIPSSAPSLTRTALPEILWGLFLLVKRKTLTESIQLRCHRIKMWQRIDPISASLWVICLWGAMEALPSDLLNSRSISSVKPYQIAGLLLHTLHEQSSHCLSSFPVVWTQVLHTFLISHGEQHSPEHIVDRAS